MSLELLPNEILLELFEYTNSVDLLYGFYNLNSRFNFLLYQQFQLYRFKFNSISKRNFDMICQQHLPFIANRIIDISLSDHKQTPEQHNLFLSYTISFNQFTKLRSLTLINLRSYEILLKLLHQCHQLNQLTHLNFHFCSFPSLKINFQLIIDNIWRLPKLTNCYIGITIENQQSFYVPSIISSSLRCVTIFQNGLQLSQINQLFENTPHLKSLSTSIKSFFGDYYIPHPHHKVSPFLTLIRLNISFPYCFNVLTIMDFFKNLHNLLHLNVDIHFELIDGYQWEQIIRNYMLKLKTFQLQMKKIFFSDHNIQEETDRLFNSFRSSFWIDEHQWFVRCFARDRTINLYTPSKQYSLHDSTHPISWKTTCSFENQHEVYENMISIYDKTFFDQPIPSNIRLLNINYLGIKLPINDQFWLIVPNLHRLKSLCISSHSDIFQLQLQTLLDQAPNLTTLTMSKDTALPLQISLFSYTNASICRLYLNDYNYCFNEEECSLLTRSPLGIQCEVLSIWINKRQSIIYIIQNMMKLRSLTIKCADDEYNYPRSRSIKDNDELIQWLKDHLSLTYMILRDSDANNKILIWI